MNDPFEFSLAAGCSLRLEQGNITKIEVDVIVNAANERMLGGGGVDGAIHHWAGNQLEEACRKIPEVAPEVRCPTGEARITPAFLLPCKYVIHTVGPVYYSAKDPHLLLASAYRNSLRIANEKRFQSIAFPAISCGAFGFPVDKAAEISLAQCRDHAGNLKTIHFVLYEQRTFDAWTQATRKVFTRSSP